MSTLIKNNNLFFKLIQNDAVRFYEIIKQHVGEI